MCSPIAVENLRPDPVQPRREFDDDDLHRLADSLKVRGQLQPIRVRWDQPSGSWVIVSGERRWRAAGMAGLPTLACVEAKGGPLRRKTILEDQLVENCLRSDLKPVEECTLTRCSWNAGASRPASSPNRSASATWRSTGSSPCSTSPSRSGTRWNAVFCPRRRPMKSAVSMTRHYRPRLRPPPSRGDSTARRSRNSCRW